VDILDVTSVIAPLAFTEYTLNNNPVSTCDHESTEPDKDTLLADGMYSTTLDDVDSFPRNAVFTLNFVR
jgi:hypothetical protein